MKKGHRATENAWEGFDGGEYVYNEAADKKYESRIWKYLAGASGLLMLLIILMHVKELIIVSQGTCIEAAYYKASDGVEIATYIDENEKQYRYDISGMDAVHSENSVRLYYLDDIFNAVPKTEWMLWCKYYLFFGCLGGLSLWRIRKIYGKANY